MTRRMLLGGLVGMLLHAGPIVVTGPEAGRTEVRVFDGRGVSMAGDAPGVLHTLDAYPGFTGGVYVAVGDVTGDGAADMITGPGAGGGPHVRVFDGKSGAEARNFPAFDPQFLGGVHVGAGDVDGDGIDDIIVGAGNSGHVRVFSGAGTGTVRDFFAFDAGFQGGVRVGAGDVNGDGLDDVIVGTGVGGGHVKVFDGRTMAESDSFFPYGSGFTGGVSVAGGSVLVGGSSNVLVYDTPGGTPRSFSPYGNFQGGIFVGASENVPEPRTWFLFSAGFGVILIVAVSRRRRR